MKKLFIDLKKEIYQLWENNLELSNFTKLPEELIYNDTQPNYIMPAKKLENWVSNSSETVKVHDLIKQLSPYVNWKQTYEEKDVYTVRNPKDIFLPSLTINSPFIFAKENLFFAYPNNFNHFVKYYRNTYQHGGISLEEIIIPCAIYAPK